MRSYHCYFLNDRGRIVGRQVMMGFGDREITERLPELLASHPQHHGVEVWERSRRVALKTADPNHA